MWSGGSGGSTRATTAARLGGQRDALAVADDEDEPQEPARIWALPGYELLAGGRAKGRSAATPRPLAQHPDHRGEALVSFQIPATVTATNTGPVVTQYEVKPDARVKLSAASRRFADDLAMALAARSIRIEAPIPGRDVVGIEIPNHTSEIVGFRPLLEDVGHERCREQADVRARPRRKRQGATRSTWRACRTC